MPRQLRSSLGRVLADLHELLGAQGLEWYLFGARAAQLRGLRRATVDVDITAVDLAAARELLLTIEAGIGEGGLVAALDHLAQRLGQPNRPEPAPPAARTAPRRRKR